MIRAFVLLIAICLTPTIALAQWTNEPAGATRLLNCSMSAADCVGGITRGTWLDVYHNLTYFSPGDAPLSPPTVARASLIHPNTVGGGVGIGVNASGPDGTVRLTDNTLSGYTVGVQRSDAVQVQSQGNRFWSNGQHAVGVMLDGSTRYAP